ADLLRVDLRFVGNMAAMAPAVDLHAASSALATNAATFCAASRALTSSTDRLRLGTDRKRLRPAVWSLNSPRIRPLSIDDRTPPSRLCPTAERTSKVMKEVEYGIEAFDLGEMAGPRYCDKSRAGNARSEPPSILDSYDSVAFAPAENHGDRQILKPLTKPWL